MNFAKLLAMLGTIILLFFISCAPKETAAPKSVEQAPAQIKVTAKDTWEVEWEKTLKAAQREAKVVIYAVTPGPALKAAGRFFKDKFGFELEVMTASSTEVRNKLVTERKNNIHIADVFITGMNTHFLASLPNKWADLMEPELTLPEVKNPDNWFEGKLPFMDPEKRVFGLVLYPTMAITINTDKVNPKAITSWDDLLKPEWTGKLVIGDISGTGTAFNSFSTLVWNKVLDLDYFRKLVKQGRVNRDERMNIDWIAKGRYPVGLFAATARVMAPYFEAGSPIIQIDIGDSYLTIDGAGAIVLNDRPHPNASRIFLNWLFSKEGQIHIQKEMGYHSARTDIGTEGVEPVNMRKPGVRYFISANQDLGWLINEQDKYLELAKEIVR